MFHERLKYLREKENISRERLAQSLDITYSALSKYETGNRQPDFDTLQRFADFFGVTTDFLLGRMDKPNYDYKEIVQHKLMNFRQDKKLTNGSIADKLGILREEYSEIEYTGSIPLHLQGPIAEILGITVDDLISNETYYQIKKRLKEEQDIAKRLKQFEEEIENSDGLAFDGEPLSDEAKESLIESMEHIFRQTQRINKKYTPKKYRDDD